MAKTNEKDIIDTTMTEEDIDETVKTTEESKQDTTSETTEKKSVWSEIGYCIKHPIQGVKKHPVIGAAVIGTLIAAGVGIAKVCTGGKADIDASDVDVDMIPLNDVADSIPTQE